MAGMTATPLAGSSPLQNLRKQLTKLRHLAQPFFLPLDQASGWQFIWLLVSLLFCVGGVVLAGLTGLMSSLETLQPALFEKMPARHRMRRQSNAVAHLVDHRGVRRTAVVGGQ